jgi:hypothetical protein
VKVGMMGMGKSKKEIVHVKARRKANGDIEALV